MKTKKKIVVAITGASGAAYGLKALQILRELGCETHLVVSKAAQITLKEELELPFSEVVALADVHYPIGDIAAPIASGSYAMDGMIIVPCSVKTLAEIAAGMSANLLSRAADVMLKERRPLVMMVRETPLHAIHLQNMLTLAQMGVVISPPVPAFYNHPVSLDDVVTYSVARALEPLGVRIENIARWEGIRRI